MTMPTLLDRRQSHAEQIAQRAGQRCGFIGIGIVGLITIVCAVIQTSIACYRLYHPDVYRKRENDPRTPQQKFIEHHRQQPNDIRDRLRASIWHQNRKLTTEQISAIADETLAQALDENNAADFNEMMEQVQ